MKITLAAALAAPLILFGCGGSEEPSSVLYKSARSLQCSPTQLTQVRLDTEVSSLRNAGVSVEASSCASDGVAHNTLCGSDNGDLFAVTVPSASVDVARQMGYQPASSYPSARPVTCQ